MSLFEQLRDTMAATLKISPDLIKEESTAEEITAWDSLGHVNLMMALEQTFDLFLDVEDFAKLNTVPAILECLRENGVG